MLNEHRNPGYGQRMLQRSWRLEPLAIEIISNPFVPLRNAAFDQACAAASSH
jgi:hypothetical protein